MRYNFIDILSGGIKKSYDESFSLKKTLSSHDNLMNYEYDITYNACMFIYKNYNFTKLTGKCECSGGIVEPCYRI